MSKQEESNTIFRGSKQYLEKSFLEELNYKIWSTKGARFEADNRLTKIAKISNISLSILSAYLIIASLISVYNLHASINIDIINYVVTALSIILLVLSQYENSQNYALRAKQFHSCGLELSNLYDRLRIFKTLNVNTNETKKREFSIKLSKEYQTILAKYENHLPIDYSNFKASHTEYFTTLSEWNIFKIKFQNFWIRYGWYSLIILLTPTFFILICIINTD